MESLPSLIENVYASIEKSWINLTSQLPYIILAILIIAIGVFIANKLTSSLKGIISAKTEDPLMTNFLGKTIKLLLVLLVSIFGLKVAGFGGIATGLFTAAGASAVIFGFAFKDIGENFISGVILSFNRPFNLNDTVSIGDIFGKVKAMEFRYTKLKTFDGKDVYIPNSDVIKKPVYNFTEDGYLRLDFVAGIAFEESIYDAERLIINIVRDTPGVVDNREHEVFVSVEELATNTVNLRIYFWVKTMEYRKEAHKIKSDVITNVKNALIEKGFNMPAEIKELKLYGNQTGIPIRLLKE